MRLLVFVCLVASVAACKDTTAPAEKPCVPDFNNPDSSKTLTVDSTGAPVIRIAWCGPITVE